ncbi:MAG: DUF6561 domain-containing protein [Nitrosarchaeum sp.]|jgi:hypothetical protein|nr:DUF6561 domain-containing protein [Nitrosarchaeum sp.]
MTVKLLLLKSGEDLIADISEMVSGEDENRHVIGYFLTKPCIVKMREPTLLTEESTEEQKKSAFQVSLYPWMPLTVDKVIPVPSDWVVTIVEPIARLTQMYIEDVMNYGKDDKDSVDGKQSNINLTD